MIQPTFQPSAAAQSSNMFPFQPPIQPGQYFIFTPFSSFYNLSSKTNLGLTYVQMHACMDTAVSTGGFPVFSNTTNQALIGQPYDLLFLKCA